MILIGRSRPSKPFIAARSPGDRARRRAHAGRAAVAAPLAAAALFVGSGSSLAARSDRPQARAPAGAHAAMNRFLQAPARTTPRAPARAAGLPGAIRAVCRHIRAHSGALHVGGGRKRLTILATGDSMIYPIDQELAMERPVGMRVVAERHDGSGLTTDTIGWPRLSARQAARVRPDVTVISLGGRDGGIPLRDARHRLVPCCATAWLQLYAGLIRPLVRAYLRRGRGRVYWLLLPAPREALRAPLFEAVNDAVRLLAPEFPAALRLIATDAVISPGGYQRVITYDGLKIRPRAPDGIHLNHEGACVERGLLTEALRADGLLH